MKKHSQKGVLSVLLCVLVLLSAVSTTFAAADEDSSAELKDGTYAENEVIVMFRSNAVFVLATRYKPSGSSSNINSPFLSVTAVAL